MTAYYNEIDPFAAAWLRELIKAGHIAPGDVDTRSIVDVRPDDLRKYTQCHFFAGIGVWSYSLRRAGWPDNRPIWTGSCPCQPWSDAGAVHGRNKAEADERDLWPDWFELIAVRRPEIILGEQVASRAAKRWYDRTADDLERSEYTCGAVITEAAAFRQAQRRERIYFAAYTGSPRGERLVTGSRPVVAGPGRWSGEADLQAIAADPFRPGSRWPAPLIRRVDDGVAARVEQLRGYGNAINAIQAQGFIEACIEAIDGRFRLTEAYPSATDKQIQDVFA